MSLKIAIYAICKNEEKNISRFAEHCRDADRIVVVDTGSTDSSVEQLRSYPHLVVYERDFKQWSFADAKNYALSLIPMDYDLTISLDLDEVLAPRWRNCLEANCRPGLAAYIHMMENVTTKFRYTNQKIHQRIGAAWDHRIHERLSFWKEPATEFLDDLVIYHHQDVEKDRSSYLPLLEDLLANASIPLRAQYFPLLVREYYVQGHFAKCREAFRRLDEAISLRSLPKAEQANMSRYAILAQIKSGERVDGKEIDQYSRLHPSRDNLFVAALMHKHQQQFKKAYQLILQAEQHTEKDYRSGFIYEEAWSDEFAKNRAELEKMIRGVRMPPTLRI